MIRSFPVAKKKSFCYYDALLQLKRFPKEKDPMKILKYVVPLILVVVVFMSCKRGGTLQSISISPSQSIISEGTTQQLTATATFTDGTTVNWTSASEWTSDLPILLPSATPDGRIRHCKRDNVYTGYGYHYCNGYGKCHFRRINDLYHPHPSCLD